MYPDFTVKQNLPEIDHRNVHSSGLLPALFPIQTERVGTKFECIS
jgi:hypothetical protein